MRTARRLGGRSSTCRRPRPNSRRLGSGAREAGVRVAASGCGGATARWWRKGWASTVRRVVRSRRACKPPATTLAELTGCSGRGRGRRSGAGRRPGVLVRLGIWTARRWRRCGRRWRVSRRSGSGSRREPSPRRQRPRPRRRRFPRHSSSLRRPARRWRSCFGSRSRRGTRAVAC